MLNKIKQVLKKRHNINNLESLIDEAQEIAFGGERVTHLYPSDLYYAHLSIYWFASQFVKDKVALDAGCGDGYGTNYLAEHGAKNIVGIDVSQIAINACQKYFVRDNLRFQVMDLARVNGFDSNSVGLIFSALWDFAWNCHIWGRSD